MQIFLLSLSSMVHCPKCGFHQPKDQYCANCGIDMENYKPKPQPFLKKLSNNTALHIVLLFILVLFATLFLTRQFKTVYYSSRGHKDINTLVIEKKNGLSQGAAKDVAETPTENPGLPPPPLPAAAAITPSEATTASTGAVSKKLHLKAEYAEIDRPELHKITENKYKPELGAYGIHDFSKSFAELKSVKILAEVEKEKDSEATTASFDFISNSSTPEVSLINHRIAISEWGDSLLRAEIAISKSNLNGKNETAHTNLNLSFDLHSNEGYLICGLLPHKIAFEPGEEMLTDALLQAYNSEKFITNRSDVCLIIYQTL